MRIFKIKDLIILFIYAIVVIALAMWCGVSWSEDKPIDLYIKGENIYTANTPGPAKHNGTNKSRLSFYKIYEFENNLCIGELGSLKYIIDCESMKPLSRGFHEIKKDGPTGYMGELGAKKYIISLNKTLRNEVNKLPKKEKEGWIKFKYDTGTNELQVDDKSSVPKTDQQGETIAKTWIYGPYIPKFPQIPEQECYWQTKIIKESEVNEYLKENPDCEPYAIIYYEKKYIDGVRIYLNIPGYFISLKCWICEK